MRNVQYMAWNTFGAWRDTFFLHTRILTYSYRKTLKKIRSWRRHFVSFM